MEDNNAQNMPITCANGCGFYGNPINNNMCSKCFKEVSQKNSNANASSTAAVTAELAPTAVTPPTPTTTPPTSTPSMTIPSAQPSEAPTVAPVPTTLVPALVQPVQQQSLPIVVSAPAPITQASVAAALIPATDSSAPGGRPVQANKGRCFMCRAKIPLAKQAINKCRCEYVFCDTHKALNKHDCDFDFAKMGKELLTKANPKLNDKPRGGRSFTRLE